MKSRLGGLFKGHSMSRAEAEELMRDLLDPATTPEQIAAALGALRSKRETRDEIVGFAHVIRSLALPVPVTRTDSLMDTCGTGGDGTGTFNISTTSALVLAGAGIAIAKHGNRSVSSPCGSADVLEALGVAVDQTPEQAAASIDAIGFGFLFSPKFHPSLARIGTVRRAIGVPTIFNILGPLANPAPIRTQVLGVYDPQLTETMAGVLGELGLREALVFTGEGGLDEISISGPTRIIHLKDGKLRASHLMPEEAGIVRAPLEALKGGPDARGNAAILESILAGEKGPRRDVVCLNAAAGFIVNGRAANFREGVELANQAIDSGQPREVLRKLREAKAAQGGSA
jgi:anthranilate phosphoribosyltransferase